ncbi:MAG: hypothetical protein ACK4QL_07750 [Pseudanabaenaceae cyanobacterium]
MLTFSLICIDLTKMYRPIYFVKYDVLT